MNNNEIVQLKSYDDKTGQETGNVLPITNSEAVKVKNNKKLTEILTELDNRIDQTNASLDNKTQQLEISKASKTEVDIERKRINNLAKLGEGSTTGDAELIDARIGADGIIYDTVGDGIRKQFNVANNDINSIKSLSEYIYLENGFVTGGYVSAKTGNFVNKLGWTSTGFIDVENISKYLYMNVARAEYHYHAFYDENKNYIVGSASSNKIHEWVIEIPANAKYFRGSFYTEDKDTFYLKGKSKLYNSVSQSEELTVATETFSPDEFEYGTIDTNNGVSASSTIRLRYYGYLSNTILKVKSNSDYEFIIYGYQNNSYIGAWNPDNNEFNKSIKWINFINLQEVRKNIQI